jgi:hypothetical protein
MSKKKIAGIIIGSIAGVIGIVTLAIPSIWGTQSIPSETTPSTTPPDAPAEVLSVWRSPPSPQGYPPILTGEVTLAKYGSEHSSAERRFFLQNYQWVDVIVKSKDMSIAFHEERPGYATFTVAVEYPHGGGYDVNLEPVEWFNVNPFLGKILYQQRTETDAGTVYTVAVRVFAEGEITDECWLGSTCVLEFENFNPYESASISYEVYELAATAGWGEFGEKAYYRTVLLPWIQQYASSESEMKQLLRQWSEQFKVD